MSSQPTGLRVTHLNDWRPRCIRAELDDSI